jgi:crossover junction endodeoxyribonuclease RuvC
MIEGYAFGAKGSSGISLGELGGVTRVALYDLNVPFIEIPPTQAKKFITGTGSAPKDIVIKELYKRFGIDTNDNNIADAVGLMILGRALVNDFYPTTDVQRQVVSDVIKSYLKEHPNVTSACA